MLRILHHPAIAAHWWNYAHRRHSHYPILRKSSGTPLSLCINSINFLAAQITPNWPSSRTLALGCPAAAAEIPRSAFEGCCWCFWCQFGRSLTHNKKADRHKYKCQPRPAECSDYCRHLILCAGIIPGEQCAQFFLIPALAQKKLRIWQI